MKAQKTFADGFKVRAKIINTKSVFSVNIQADKFSEFLKNHKNEKGYVTIDCWELDQPDKYGHTHNASLNEWTPTKKSAPSQAESIDDDMPF
jgi:hypothetical protein